MYKLDTIKNQLKIELDKAVALKKAWESVTFQTKKNGEPFKIMSKNISGAKYTVDDFAMQVGENRLTVYTHCTSSGYIHDTINCYELVKYLTDDDKIKKIINYVPKVSYLEQVYKYDIEDIKNAVIKRIAYFENRIKSLNTQLDIVDNIYIDFLKKYNKLLQELEVKCDTNDLSYSNHKNDIYYRIKEAIVGC